MPKGTIAINPSVVICKQYKRDRWSKARNVVGRGNEQGQETSRAKTKCWRSVDIAIDEARRSRGWHSVLIGPGPWLPRFTKHSIPSIRRPAGAGEHRGVIDTVDEQEATIVEGYFGIFPSRRTRNTQ